MNIPLEPTQAAPCPFCGRTRNLVVAQETPSAYCLVTCNCGAHGPDCPTYEKALQAWNRRSTPITVTTDLEFFAGNPHDDHYAGKPL